MDNRERFLLNELRQIRADRGVTQDELAKRTNWATSTIAMIETGARKPPEDFWPRCDQALNTGGTLSRLADEFDTPQWKVDWETAEAAAVLLRAFEPLVIPGLLQTEAYVRALFGGAGCLRGEALERYLNERLKRQEILTREKPPELFAVLDEGALRRPVGGPDIMREQLHALVKVAQEPHVHLFVVPRSVGEYPGLNGPFVLATGPDQQVTGYLDTALRGHVVDDPEQIAALGLAWEVVRGQALPEAQSLAVILDVADNGHDGRQVA